MSQSEADPIQEKPYYLAKTVEHNQELLHLLAPTPRAFYMTTIALSSPFTGKAAPLNALTFQQVFATARVSMRKTKGKVGNAWSFGLSSQSYSQEVVSSSERQCGARSSSWVQLRVTALPGTSWLLQLERGHWRIMLIDSLTQLTTMLGNYATNFVPGK
ncbi:hypothetical protein CRYUN_Cryun23aG0113700 [Craigia yunnanensis]